MGRRGERKAWWMMLMLAFVLVVGVAASGDDGDDDDDEGTTKAAFEVDGEVRHDWGQNNLREWDGHVRVAQPAHRARTSCVGDAPWRVQPRTASQRPPNADALTPAGNLGRRCYGAQRAQLSQDDAESAAHPG